MATEENNAQQRLGQRESVFLKVPVHICQVVTMQFWLIMNNSIM